MTHLLRLPLLAMLALTAGCLYRMEVQQGNRLDESQVSQLETGMTRSQVLYLLGTPMVPPGFNNDRWDYYHFLNDFKRPSQTRRLTVWFKDDLVERIEDDAPRAAKKPEATESTQPSG
jgi:outer membrane protein assembly factor BamE